MSHYSLNQKGLAPILIIVGILVFGGAVGGAYFFGTKQSTAPVPSATVAPTSVPSSAAAATTPPTQILQPSPSALSASTPTSAPSVQVSTVKTQEEIKSTVLNYTLPSGWKTLNSSNNSFQVGYDPILYEGEQTAVFEDNVNIERSKQCCFNFYVNIKPYNGGSRHAFIGTNYDKTPQTYEKNYTINGRGGLVIYNILASSQSALAMLDIDGKRAFFIAFYGGDEAYIEKVLASLKVLN